MHETGNLFLVGWKAAFGCGPVTTSEGGNVICRLHKRDFKSRSRAAATLLASNQFKLVEVTEMEGAPTRRNQS